MYVIMLYLSITTSFDEKDENGYYYEIMGRDLKQTVRNKLHNIVVAFITCSVKYYIISSYAMLVVEVVPVLFHVTQIVTWQV